MGIVIGTLILNEMEWLSLLWDQHRFWPELEKWVFVEAADRVYATINPHLVSDNGLSVDGTTQFLQFLAQSDKRVQYVPYGFTEHADPARCKQYARQVYFDVAAELQPEAVIVLDADEFYTRDDQRRVNDLFREHPEYEAFIIPKREIWHPPSVAHEPLFSYEAVRGFWGIPCCHLWRWRPGVGYKTCHVTPESADGIPLNHLAAHYQTDFTMPQMVHLGFASEAKTREAKNNYYSARGEAMDPKRLWYVNSRRAFSEWQLGQKLPHGARVVEYSGPIPEVFR